MNPNTHRKCEYFFIDGERSGAPPPRARVDGERSGAPRARGASSGGAYFPTQYPFGPHLDLDPSQSEFDEQSVYVFLQ